MALPNPNPFGVPSYSDRAGNIYPADPAGEQTQEPVSSPAFPDPDTSPTWMDPTTGLAHRGLPTGYEMQVPAAPYGSYEYIKDMQLDAQQERTRENDRIDNRAALKLRMEQLRQESDARAHDLIGKMESLAQELSQPYAAKPVTMNPAEMYAGLIQTLFGGSTGAVQGANNALAVASQRTELENQNELNAYKARQAGTQTQYQTAEHSLGNEEIYRRNIDNQEIDSLQQQLKQDHQDGQSLRAAWEKASDPGEIKTASRLLREQFPEFAPTEREEGDKIRASGAKAAKEYNDMVQAIWQHSTTVTEADRIKLETWRKSLADPNGYGIPIEQLAAVPTSETLGKARLDETQRHNKQVEELSKKKFHWEKNTEFKARMQLGWFNAHTARTNLAQAQERNDLGMMNFYRQVYDDQTNKSFLEIGKKITGLKVQIQGKEAELAKSTGKHARDIQHDIDDLKGQLKGWQDETAQQNGDRLGAGLPSVDPEQLIKDALEFSKTQQPTAPFSVGQGTITPDGTTSTGGKTPPKVVKVEKIK